MNLRQSIVPLLFLAVLPATRGDLIAQERSPANESSDSDRVAVPNSEAEPPSGSVLDTPSDTPPDSSSGAPPDTSSEEAVPDSSSGAPPDSSSDTPAPPERYAVPVPELPEAHRQPPNRGRHAVPETPGEPPAASDDGDIAVLDDAPVESYGSPGGAWPLFGRRVGGRGAVGALDLDVSPGRTQIYLDGQYVGIADRYDGWPSYLWLEEGTYDLVFYLDGYKTLARRVTIDPGLVIGLEDRLEPGPSVRPEDFD